MSTPPYILVVGSSNTDMVINSHHLPAPGETIIGSTFFMNPGGKGANQAVAAARLGGHVTFICKTGNDIFGKRSLQLLHAEGINTSYILVDNENPSGIALITVNREGENCIVVASGSNAALRVSDLASLKEIIQKANTVLLQLEIPLSTVEFVAATAKAAGVKVILNPAPAAHLPDQLLKNVDIVTPNETEAEMLTGIPIIDEVSATLAAEKLKSKGIKTVIITMGAQGALLLNDDCCKIIPSISVKAVDTTAAGDVFNGALAVALSENYSISDAISFACKSAAISVTRLGAQASAPYKHEIF